MQEHELWLTALFNHYLPGFANWALALVGLHAANPAKPWANYMTMQFVVALILIVAALILRRRLSMDKPGGLQHVVEVVYLFVRGQSDEVVGEQGRQYVGMFATIFLFILLGNLLGVIPGFEPPTMFPPVPLGCALLVFAYYNVVGFSARGVGKYLAHFAGPVAWLAPLMVPIEIISHLSRPLSLTARLFANMFAGENVVAVFIKLTYFALPLAFIGLHMFEALVQAYIFVLLTMVYVQGAVVEEH